MLFCKNINIIKTSKNGYFIVGQTVGGGGTRNRYPCCVLLALSWNTNENSSTDKLSRAINYIFLWISTVDK